MTRSELAKKALEYATNRAICKVTVPELFHFSGRVLRVDELTRMPLYWLKLLVVKCSMVVEDFSEQSGVSKESKDGEIVWSVVCSDLNDVNKSQEDHVLNTPLNRELRDSDKKH